MRRHSLARRLLGCAVLLAALAAPGLARSQSSDGGAVMREIRQLAWQRGPADGSLGAVATLKIAEGHGFLDAANTKRFLELTGNPPRDHRYTLMAPDARWFAIFFFEDSGYVKDDEKLDPEALLKSLQASDRAGNEERKRLGMPQIHTAGWSVPPHYDPATRRLEWGVQLRGDDGHQVVNYAIRLLGRRGVMHAILVSGPDRLTQDVADFKAALAGYTFVPGERYAEFRAGDRVAEYGLAALVLGGAAAVATKSGFLKAFGKLIVVGAIGLGAALLAVFRRLFGRG
jgi:uncharacterized membrane-anchored protein